MNKKLSMLLVLILGLSLLAIGCSNAGQEKDPGQTGQAIKLNISRSNQNISRNMISTQTVSDQIKLDKFVVTITNGDKQKTKEVSADKDQVVFNEVPAGDWEVEVVAKDEEGHDCYSGSAKATVVNGTTTVDVDIYLLNGNLDLTVKLPTMEDTTIASGEVKLVNPRSDEDHIKKELNINEAEGTVDFGEVKAGTWFMEVELFDSTENKVAWGSGSATVLPSRDNQAVIEFNSDNLEGGDLEVTIDVHPSPEDPTGLTAKTESGNVTLDWEANPEDNIDGYAIYRAKSEDGFKQQLNNYELVSATSYTDTNVESGESYHYWVQAYNDEGYSSDFSDNSSVTVAESTGGQVDLSQYNNVVYVDAENGSDAEGNGTIDNSYQTLDTAMENVEINNNEAIYLKDGFYTVDSMHDMFDLKEVDFIGEGLDTEVEIYGNRNRVYNQDIVNDFYKIKFTVHDNYNQHANQGPSGAIVLFGRTISARNASYDLGIYNCVFDTKDQLKNRVFGADGTSAGGDFTVHKFEIVNTVFKVDDLNILRLTAHNNEEYKVINSATTSDSFYWDKYSSPTIKTSLTNATLDSNYNITSDGWQDEGTGTDPDGSSADIGVYGGDHAWSK